MVRTKEELEASVSLWGAQNARTVPSCLASVKIPPKSGKGKPETYCFWVCYCHDNTGMCMNHLEIPKPLSSLSSTSADEVRRAYEQVAMTLAAARGRSDIVELLKELGNLKPSTATEAVVETVPVPEKKTPGRKRKEIDPKPSMPATIPSSNSVCATFDFTRAPFADEIFKDTNDKTFIDTETFETLIKPSFYNDPNSACGCKPHQTLLRTTPLAAAVVGGHMKTVKTIVENCGVNAKNIAKYRILDLAVQNMANNKAVAKSKKEKGGSKQTKKKIDENNEGDDAIVFYLLDSFWNTSPEERKAAVDFLLWTAVVNNKSKLLEKLIVKEGANVGTIIDGKPAMVMATSASKPSKEIISLLASPPSSSKVAKKSSSSSDSQKPAIDMNVLETPLHSFVKGDKTDMELVKKFVEEIGYGPEHEDPLRAYAEKSRDSFTMSRKNITPLLFIAGDNLPLLRYLMSKGWDPKKEFVYSGLRTIPKESLLYSAAKRGNVDTVKFFVEECGFAPSDPFENQGPHFNNSLGAAARSRSIPALKYLLSKGWKCTTGRSPLLEAVDGEMCSDTPLMCPFLIEKCGVKPNQRDPILGGTPVQTLKKIMPFGSLYGYFKDKLWELKDFKE